MLCSGEDKMLEGLYVCDGPCGLITQELAAAVTSNIGRPTMVGFVSRTHHSYIKTKRCDRRRKVLMKVGWMYFMFVSMKFHIGMGAAVLHRKLDALLPVQSMLSAHVTVQVARTVQVASIA